MDARSNITQSENSTNAELHGPYITQHMLDNFNINPDISNSAWTRIRSAANSIRTNNYAVNTQRYANLSSNGQIVRSSTGFEYLTLTGKPIKLFNTKWKKEYKEINSDSNQECSIILEQIEDEYCTCEECSQNFDYAALKRWLQTKKECPLCRTDWSNYTIYSNK